MVTFGVIRKIGGNHPFVYCMTETKERAESIIEMIKDEEQMKNSIFSVESVKDSCRIGDYYEEVKL